MYRKINKRVAKGCPKKEELKMLTLISLVILFAVFGRLLIFGLKLGWGIMKLVGFVVFLPFIILMMILGGLSFVALPILLVIGIVSMAVRA